jgi:hypothetical protein
MSQDDTMIRLAALRKSLTQFMKPEILKNLAKLLEDTQYGETSLVERYEWFCKNAENGPDCRYAAMAKTFFLRDQAEQTAADINWLYHNFSKFYEEKE